MRAWWVLGLAGCVVRGEGLSVYECHDGIDNDRDGRIDCDDAPCGAYAYCATANRPGQHEGTAATTPVTPTSTGGSDTGAEPTRPTGTPRDTGDDTASSTDTSTP